MELGPSFAPELLTAADPLSRGPPDVLRSRGGAPEADSAAAPFDLLLQLLGNPLPQRLPAGESLPVSSGDPPPADPLAASALDSAGAAAFGLLPVPSPLPLPLPLSAAATSSRRGRHCSSRARRCAASRARRRHANAGRRTAVLGAACRRERRRHRGTGRPGHRRAACGPRRDDDRARGGRRRYARRARRLARARCDPRADARGGRAVRAAGSRSRRPALARDLRHARGACVVARERARARGRRECLALRRGTAAARIRLAGAGRRRGGTRATPERSPRRAAADRSCGRRFDDVELTDGVCFARSAVDRRRAGHDGSIGGAASVASRRAGRYELRALAGRAREPHPLARRPRDRRGADQAQSARARRARRQDLDARRQDLRADDGAYAPLRATSSRRACRGSAS